MAGAELKIGMSSYPVDGDHPLVPALRATFDAARDFGLTDDELWSTVREAVSGSEWNADLSECVDRLTDELTQAVLAKQARQVSSSF